MKTKLFILLIVVAMACSCRKVENDFKVYKIYQGNHYCNGWRLLKANNDIRFSFIFSGDCIYNESAQVCSGWNKLYGISDINNHSNSARIGWRCVCGKIVLGWYVYVNGLCSSGYMDTIQAGQEGTGRIMYGGSDLTIQVNNKFVVLKGTQEPTALFYQFPYFGGEETAPRDMTIYIKNFTETIN